MVIYVLLLKIDGDMDWKVGMGKKLNKSKLMHFSHPKRISKVRQMQYYAAKVEGQT